MPKNQTIKKRVKPFVQSSAYYRKLKVKIKENKQELLGQASIQEEWVVTTSNVSKVFI